MSRKNNYNIAKDLGRLDNRMEVLEKKDLEKEKRIGLIEKWKKKIEDKAKFDFKKITIKGLINLIKHKNTSFLGVFAVFTPVLIREDFWEFVFKSLEIVLLGIMKLLGL